MVQDVCSEAAMRSQQFRWCSPREKERQRGRRRRRGSQHGGEQRCGDGHQTGGRVQLGEMRDLCVRGRQKLSITQAVGV